MIHDARNKLKSETPESKIIKGRNGSKLFTQKSKDLTKKKGDGSFDEWGNIFAPFRL